MWLTVALILTVVLIVLIAVFYRVIGIYLRRIEKINKMLKKMKEKRGEETGKGFWTRLVILLIMASGIELVVWRIVIPRILKALPFSAPVEKVIEIVIVFLILLSLLWWAKTCFKVVGTLKVPSQAVVTRFARAIAAVRTGLCLVLRPFEDLKEFPTGQYKMEYQIEKGLYSRENKEQSLSSQSMEVGIVVYFRWPRIERTYSFPVPTEEARKTLAPGSELNTEGLEEKGLAWVKIMGKELLMKAYYRVPVKDPMGEGVTDELGGFFKGGVVGGVRHIMSAKTSLECREKKPEIEKEIKNYLISEEGNPFFESGTPRECLDIEITRVKFPEDTEKAWKSPEIKSKEAEAAVFEKKSIMRKMEGYTEKGVPEEIAALVVGGVEGKGMTMEQLRDLKILEALGGFGKASSKDGQLAKQRFSKKDLIDMLRKLSTTELKEIAIGIK